ncbi:MAG TPA: phosphotransferase, partial [Rhodopila sp.]|nr:phosphotransferase [Rhodopila sp.]
EAYGIVVSSWVDGPTLEKSLFRGAAARRRILTHDAGVWLARLHTACGVEYRTPDIAGMLDRLEAEMAKRTDGTGLGRHGLRLLRTAGAALVGQPAPWSCHYGDFKPANLIVRDGRLVAIDVELVSSAPTVNDVAHFLNHLQLGLYSPRAMRRWGEPSLLAELFCRGYADAAGKRLPHDLLQWQRLYNAMFLMSQHREWCRSPMAWPMQLTLRRLVRTLCGPLGG